MKRRTFLITGAAAAIGVPAFLRSQSLGPELVGQWGPMTPHPDVPIHCAAIPNTREVFCVHGRGTIPVPLNWRFNTEANTFYNPGEYDKVLNPLPYNATPFPYSAMCGGLVHDEYGDIRAYGGNDPGADRSGIFEPATNTWEWGPWLSGKKSAYYCSAIRRGPTVKFPDGSIIIGWGRRSWIDEYSLEDYNPDLVIPRMPDSSNITLAGSSSSNYPRIFAGDDSAVYLLGSQKAIMRLDPDTYMWSLVGNMLFGNRNYGCATPLSWPWFLLSGGDSVRTRMEVVNVLTGEITETATLAIGRYNHNTLILPDGTVLIAGGTGTATSTPELYNHQTGTVRKLAPSTSGITRGYHSILDLLDDGRVLWGGGLQGQGASTEVFTPPYLLQGVPPELDPTPQEASYGGTLTLNSHDAASIDQMVIMTPGVISHGTNFGQRRHVCPFTVSDGQVHMAIPTNQHALLSGYHRVFALRSGVPSTCAWVHVEA